MLFKAQFSIETPPCANQKSSANLPSPSMVAAASEYAGTWATKTALSFSDRKNCPAHIGFVPRGNLGEVTWDAKQTGQLGRLVNLS